MTELPDLDPGGPIIAENVRALGPMIVAAMFEELKVFQVVDRIVEQFQQGTLPIGPGDAGRKLHDYWRDAPKRIGARERRGFAAAALGIVGGDRAGASNRAFDELWLRFVSSLSSLVRQDKAGAKAQACVRKAARELARTLSDRGSGPAGAAARRLRAQTEVIVGLLQEREILRSYGARDMWQLIERVAADALGGARNGARHRTLATNGAIITAWLANNVARIERDKGPLIDVARARDPRTASKRGASRHPTDHDLAKACELWLAERAREPSNQQGETGW